MRAPGRAAHHRKPRRQDHTLLPSADVPPRTSGSLRVLATEAEKNRCDRAGSFARIAMAHRHTRPATSSRAGAAASIASRLTYRDDRETPFLPGRDVLRFTRRDEFG